MTDRKIFFDLDGTLINPGKRLYKLFIQLSGIDISEEAYHILKRDMVSNADIMTRFLKTEEQVKLFQSDWLQQIEEPVNLDQDELFPYTIQVMESLIATGFTLFIVSARQSKERAVEQLEKLGLSKFAKEILVTGHQMSKAELIRALQLPLTANDFLVGDTGMDIRAGKELQLQTVGVLSGSRNRAQLEKYAPGFLYNSIEEFAEELGKTISSPFLS